MPDTSATGRALADVQVRCALLAERLADDWPDRRGREWADTLAALVRDLERTVDALLAGAASPRRAGGMRLAGTEATRENDERGMRLADAAAQPAEEQPPP